MVISNCNLQCGCRSIHINVLGSEELMKKAQRRKEEEKSLEYPEERNSSFLNKYKPSIVLGKMSRDIFCSGPKIDLFLQTGSVFVHTVSSLVSSVFIRILTLESCQTDVTFRLAEKGDFVFRANNYSKYNYLQLNQTKR